MSVDGIMVSKNYPVIGEYVVQFISQKLLALTTKTGTDFLDLQFFIVIL